MWLNRNHKTIRLVGIPRIHAKMYFIKPPPIQQASKLPFGPDLALLSVEGFAVENLIVSAALIGSLGTAWVIQRAILAVCVRVIDPNRR
jgi:hypothetical protein